MIKRLTIALIITISLGVGSIMGYVYSKSSQQPISTTTQSATEQVDKNENKRMELVTRLQQVNESIAINMEEIIKTNDNINTMNRAITSSMQRIQQAQIEMNELRRWDLQSSSMMGAHQSTIDNEQCNISFCMGEINKYSAKLADLQKRQVELEEERVWLLAELTKLGQ